MKREGKSVQYSNTGAAISKGDVVVMGALIGIAAMDIAATTGIGTVDLVGVHTAVKVTGADIGLGETVLYDVSASNFDDNAATPASGDVLAGAVAMEAAGTGTTTFDILLTPGAGTVTA